MTTAAKRDKLRDFVEICDDEEIEIMFSIFEEQLEDRFKWWEDEEFVAELKERVRAYESGEVRGVPWEEVKANARAAREEKLRLMKKASAGPLLSADLDEISEDVRGIDSKDQ